jgi:hypothetical protein
MTQGERRDEITREPEAAPTARATDPQKPGEPLRPGPQPDTGRPSGGVAQAPSGSQGGERPDGPDDRGRDEGDRGGL